MCDDVDNPLLRCSKHGELIPARGAYCRHRDEPCKYRTDCMIFLLGEIDAPRNNRQQAANS